MAIELGTAATRSRPIFTRGRLALPQAEEADDLPGLKHFGLDNTLKTVHEFGANGG
jgi:hypothetical protein